MNCFLDGFVVDDLGVGVGVGVGDGMDVVVVVGVGVWRNFLVFWLMLADLFKFIIVSKFFMMLGMGWVVGGEMMVVLLFF